MTDYKVCYCHFNPSAVSHPGIHLKPFLLYLMKTIYMGDILSEKISVNEACEKSIHIIYRQYNAIALIYSLASLTALATQAIRFLKYRHQLFDNWLYVVNLQVIPFVFTLNVLIGVLQVYNYFNGVRYQRRAITESSQFFFNKSFVFFKRGNNYAIAALVISLLYELLFLYEEFYI